MRDASLPSGSSELLKGGRTKVYKKNPLPAGRGSFLFLCSRWPRTHSPFPPHHIYTIEQSGGGLWTNGKILAYGKLADLSWRIRLPGGFWQPWRSPCRPFPRQRRRNRQWSYHHHVSQHLKQRRQGGKYVITPKTLEEVFAYLKAHGYTAVTISDLIAYQEGRKELPQKPVMITFDDGYYNNYSYAFPLLKKYDMKAVISVIGRYTDEYSASMEKMNNNYSQLTWDQIREMMDSGYVEFANHSYDMHSDTTRRGVKRNTRRRRGNTEWPLPRISGRCRLK